MSDPSRAASVYGSVVGFYEDSQIIIKAVESAEDLGELQQMSRRCDFFDISNLDTYIALGFQMPV